MENSKVISTHPKDRLKIYLKKDVESVVAFRVHNNGNKPLVCRMNSNQKELYVVKPTRFLLPAGGTKIVSVRCDVDSVNDLLETDLPSRNILQIAGYRINSELHEDMMACGDDKALKEFIGNKWEEIKKSPCEKSNLDVKFTNILLPCQLPTLASFPSFLPNPDDVPYSTCASPVGERADYLQNLLSPYGISKESILAAFVAVGVAVIIGFLWRH